MLNPMLSTKEMAACLHVSPQTIRNRAARKLINGVRIGRQWRFDRDAVMAKLTESVTTDPDNWNKALSTDAQRAAEAAANEL